MIAIAGVIPLRRAPTDVAQLLRLIVDLMAPQAKALDVTLTAAVDNDAHAAIAIDAQKIAWAASALVGNALRYVRHGTARMPGGAITVRATRDAEAHELVVEVQDDGRGIPEALVRGLSAEPQSKNPYNALALTMIRDVVVAHGGRLEIESRTDVIGHGTTVRFTLPVA
jgi:signal transduction histidine kinase